MNKMLVAILAISVLAFSGCGGGGGGGEAATLAPVPSEYAGQTNPFGAEAAGAGADVFKVNCESCHGPQGHGDGPAGAALDPAPKNLADLQAQVGDDYLFWRISAGKGGTSMVAWKGILTDEQIWQAVAFIRTLK